MTQVFSQQRNATWTFPNFGERNWMKANRHSSSSLTSNSSSSRGTQAQALSYNDSCCSISSSISSSSPEVWLLPRSVPCFLRPHFLMMSRLMSAELDAVATVANKVLRTCYRRRFWVVNQMNSHDLVNLWLRRHGRFGIVSICCEKYSKKSYRTFAGILRLEQWPFADIFTFAAEPPSCYGNGFGSFCVLQAAPERNPFVESAAEIS